MLLKGIWEGLSFNYELLRNQESSFVAQKEMKMGNGGIDEEEVVDDPNSSLIPSFDSSDDLLMRTGNSSFCSSMSHGQTEIRVFTETLIRCPFKETRFLTYGI